MDTRHGRIIMLGLLIIALMISATSAFAVIVHDAEVQVGSTIEVPIEIDEIPNNLWYYKITLTNTDPVIGEFVDAKFDTWVMLTQSSALPSDTLWMKGGALNTPKLAGAKNVSLGSFKVRGDRAGTSLITAVVDSMESDDSLLLSPAVINGNLEVLALTGDLEVTSVPPEAAIELDGASTGEVTPHTFTGLDVGDHPVKVTLADYEPAEKTAKVVAGDTVTADFTLVKLTGDLEVLSTPAEAAIELDGASTGEVTPHTFTGLDVGDHPVKVTLADYEPAEKTAKVVAGDTVTADFTLEPIPPATGSIKVTSDPPGAEIWIDTVDTGETTEFTFDGIAPGDHTVKVTLAGYEDAEQTVNVIDGETFTADFTLVEVPNPPMAEFLAFPRQGTAPLAVLFLDLSRGSPTSREWDFGDGSTSGEMFPLHTYAKPGKYTVKLTVSNSGGSDTMVRENFIIVRATNPPKAQFTAYPQDGTAPLAVTFLDLSRGYPSSRVWDFGDGTTSTDVNPVHVYGKPGKYTVSLTVTNDAGSDTASQKNFIKVDAVKLKGTEKQEEKEKAKVSENNPQTSNSQERPQIKIT